MDVREVMVISPTLLGTYDGWDPLGSRAVGRDLELLYTMQPTPTQWNLTRYLEAVPLSRS